MADKEEPKKKQSTIKQIIQIFKYTHAEDKALPWLCGGVFVAPIVVFVVLGIVFKWSVIGWITSMILAISLACCSPHDAHQPCRQSRIRQA